LANFHWANLIGQTGIFKLALGAGSWYHLIQIGLRQHYKSFVTKGIVLVVMRGLVWLKKWVFG